MTDAKNDRPQFEPPIWQDSKGQALSGKEKIKVLNENLEEIRELAQDALEDGILMGAAEAQIRDTLQRLLESLKNPYGEGR